MLPLGGSANYKFLESLMPWYPRWRTSPFFALLLTIGTYSLLHAGQQPSSPQAQSPAAPSLPVLKATTRLVVVDVVATDGKGEPVADLTADDFTVLEDGKPQKISGFSFQHVTA